MSLLSSAASLFSRSAISSAYNIHTSPSPTPTPSPGPSSASASNSSGAPPKPVPWDPPFQVGLWRVTSATKKTTGQVVSVWSCDKRQLDGLKGQARDSVVDALKREASSLTRLRHPNVLEVVEPCEETRSELIFATEKVVSSLSRAITTSSRNDELDEVETQKGLLQIARALQFLHGTNLVHHNLTPEAILINAKGDWKLAGLALLTPLVGPDGAKTKWVFPEYDPRLPAHVQVKLDYLAPEYAIDEELSTSSDMYSLGCIIHAIHAKGRPPFANRNSLHTLRQNADSLRTAFTSWARFGSDVQEILSHLLTRAPSTRLTSTTFAQSPFFSSLLVNTLAFLSREVFATKSRDEKINFMRGLPRVLDQFGERVKRRKILPGLVDEMRDPYLLPFILPNVFIISKSLTKDEFADTVLQSLKPLFSVRDPPQNLITLLDNLELLQEKTTTVVFREHVMPLVYSALETEHPAIQEKALKLIPALSESLDYGMVKTMLFPHVTTLFQKTKILSVKVNALICFHAMIKVLDEFVLTEKLVPLLAKIKTKEPSVMIATLAVHEEMGRKVTREAVATQILPQLWTMSMGPLLNADQFARFIKAIKALGARVEAEHAQHLRERRRLEEHQTSYVSTGAVTAAPGIAANGEIDFQSLVSGGVPNGSAAVAMDDDPWASLDAETSSPAPTLQALTSPRPSVTSIASSSVPSTPAMSPKSVTRPIAPSTASKSLGARPLAPSAFNTYAFAPPPQPSRTNSSVSSPSTPGLPNYSNGAASTTTSFTPLQPLGSSLPPLQPTTSSLPPPLAPSSSTSQYIPPQPQNPNYNISLTHAPSITPAFAASPMAPTSATPAAPPGFASGGMLTPTSLPGARGWNGAAGGGKGGFGDFGEFDPLG